MEKEHTNFTLSEEDWDKVEAWDECAASDAGVEGGKWTFKFIPTGLGMLVKVHCCVCGRELDLTDWENFG